MLSINTAQKKTLLSAIKNISRVSSEVLRETIYMEVLPDNVLRFRIGLDFHSIINVSLLNVIHDLKVGSRFLVSIQALKIPSAFSFDVGHTETVAYLDNGAEMRFAVYEIGLYPVMREYTHNSEYLPVLINAETVELIKPTSTSSRYKHYVFAEEGQFCFSSTAFCKTCDLLDFDEGFAVEIEDIIKFFTFGKNVFFAIDGEDILLKNTDLQSFMIIWQIPHKKIDKKSIQYLLNLPENQDIEVQVEPDIIKSLLQVGKDYIYIFYKHEGIFYHGIRDVYSNQIVTKVKAKSQPQTEVGFALSPLIAKRFANLRESHVRYQSNANATSEYGDIVTVTTMPMIIELKNKNKVIVAPIKLK